MGIVEDVQKRAMEEQEKTCKFCGRTGATEVYIGHNWHKECLERAKSAGRL